jgi:uncharacterized protein YoxC
VEQREFYIVVTVAAAVITLSFVIQVIMLALVHSSVRKLARIVSSLQSRAEPLMDQTQVIVTKLRKSIEEMSAQARDTLSGVAVEARAAVAALSTSSREIAEMARRQTEQLSATLDYSNRILQRQVTEFDLLLARTQERIEETTLELQASLMKPLSELRALVAGIKRAFEILFGRSLKPIDQAYQDEELFI